MVPKSPVMKGELIPDLHRVGVGISEVTRELIQSGSTLHDAHFQN